MNTFSAIIADDDALGRRSLELLMTADPELRIVMTCANGRSAVEAIRDWRPDFAFLDVQMPQLDGFEVLAELDPMERPQVVFVTAHREHAIRAFEVSAVDYLLKPFTPERLAAAVRRAKDAVLKSRTGYLSAQVQQLLSYARDFDGMNPVRRSPGSSSKHLDQLVLKVTGALQFLKSAEVIWIEAQGDFLKVQTSEKTHLARETLQSVEQKLDPTKFLRIHRSFLVNLDHVERVESALYGDYSVYMTDGSKLRLSRSRRSKLEALIRRSPTS